MNEGFDRMATTAPNNNFMKMLPNPWSNSSAQSRSPLRQQQTLKSGWLRKQGGVVKSWHRRWFTLKGDQLYYYTGEDENKLLGTIFLPGNKVVEYPLSPHEPDRFVFQIVPGESRSRMTVTHETYPLVASTEDERRGWIQAIKKVIYADKGGAIFGQSLSETIAYENRTAKRKVPQIVEMCVDFILKEGLQVEGIFRLPGRSTVIRQLRDDFDTGNRPVFDTADVDIHSVASLLKLYLRELPEPIIPMKFYESVMKIVNRDLHENPDAAIERLSTLLTNIPRHNYNLLKYLCHFLREVAKYSHVNKMDQMNLATVFLHSIIQPEDSDPALLMGTANNRTQCVFLLISMWYRIFKLEYNIQGISVKVDNLLDIGQFPGETFKAGTDTSHMPALQSNLLDLDLGSAPAVEGLLEPVVAAPVAKEVTCISGDQVELPCKEDIPQSESSSQSESVMSSGSYDSASEEPDSPKLTKVPPVPPPRDRSQHSTLERVPISSNDVSNHSTIPEKNNFYCSTSDENTFLSGEVKATVSPVHTRTEASIPTRPAPPPPIATRAHLKSSLSVESLESEDSSTESGDSNRPIEDLLKRDLNDFNSSEILGYVNDLCSELRLQVAKVNELKSKITKLKRKHEEKVQCLAKKMDTERSATADAVNKVMCLQNQLQEYQLKYGI